MYNLININFKNKILGSYKDSFKMNVQNIVAYNKTNREYTYVANNRFNIIRYINHNDNDLYILNHLHSYIEKFTRQFGKDDDKRDGCYIFNTDYIKHFNIDFHEHNKSYIILNILEKEYKITNFTTFDTFGIRMEVVMDIYRKKNLVISTI